MKTNPLDPTLRDLNDCGCCTGTEAQTPAAIGNRPGLPAVRFRAGTQSQFKASLLAALSDIERKQLGKLRTRENDDFTIALLDSFAAMADVLTFYSERIANEGFLGTATERRSVLELARAIGYELKAGVAASTWLAFTVEDSPGAPGFAVIPRGTRVQSVPGPDEKPQTFETSVEFEARAAWNEFRLRRSQPQALPTKQDEMDKLDELYLRGIKTNLKVADVILVSGVNSTIVTKPISALIPDPERDHTWIKLSPSAANPAPNPPPYITPKVMTVFSAIGKTTGDLIKANYSSNIGALAGNISYAATNRVGIPREMVMTAVAFFRRPEPLPPIQGVFALRTRTGFFGHNAPKWTSLPHDKYWDEKSPRAGYANDWDVLPAPTSGPSTILQNSQGEEMSPDNVFLDRVIPEIVKGSWVVFDSPTKQIPYRVDSVSEESRADYAMSGKCTKLHLLDKGGTSSATELDQFKNRTTTAYVNSERLELAESPITSDLARDATELPLDRLDLHLRIGQSLLLTGERTDLRGVQVAERIVIKDLRHGDGITILTLRDKIQFGYVRDSVRILGNIVHSTHGESVAEITGNGDATRVHQQFVMRQRPVTHVFPTSGDATASSLEVWVNDVKWSQAPSLYQQPPDARVFVARVQDDGTTVITFGDGQQGARLPSGQENVRAVYRKGIGAAGFVKAGQLSLLVSRPLGIKAVTNPLASVDAQDPETLADARQRAPLYTLTLDRVVSLQDYEDFARTFDGVAKARAVWGWSASGRGVALTVIGPAGKVIEPKSDLEAALALAFQRKGDARVPVRMKSKAPVRVGMEGNVLVAADRDMARVEAAVKSALLEGFSFEARQPGQSIYLSELLEVIHRVPGVIAAGDIAMGRIVLEAGEYKIELSPDGGLAAARPVNGVALDENTPAAELLMLDEFSFSELQFVRATP